MIELFQKGATQNYIYIDSVTDALVGWYGETPSLPLNMGLYASVGEAPLQDTTRGPEYTNDQELALYNAAIAAGHSAPAALVVSGQNGG